MPWATATLCFAHVQFRVDLPNSVNFVFNARGFAVLMLLPTYGIGAPFLFKYMLGQRKRKLSASRKKE